jgi:hypothetical protein
LPIIKNHILGLELRNSEIIKNICKKIVLLHGVIEHPVHKENIATAETGRRGDSLARRKNPILIRKMYTLKNIKRP